MIEIRPLGSLGGDNHGWLDAKHHFSFGDYHDRRRMNWGCLRVWNDDAIQPQTGFPPHSHSDMEIITYVRDGAITHQDSLGNKGRTQAGDVQVMSAGTGIRHSEYNLESDVTRIFQIWILPDRIGEPPSWGTKPFPQANQGAGFVVMASGMAGDAEALPIRANARVLGAGLAAGAQLTYAFSGPSRFGYLVPAKGKVRINGLTMSARDGAAIQDERQITIVALEDSELVLADVSG